MPDDLAEDLMRTLNEMRAQNDALRPRMKRKTALRTQFQADIDRYKELARARRANARR